MSSPVLAAAMPINSSQKPARIDSISAEFGAGFVSDLPKLPNPQFPISPENKNARPGRASPGRASRFSAAPSILPEVG